MSKNFFRTSAEDFKKIPGSPVAYWVSDDIRKIFATNNPLHLQMECIQGIITGNTNKYIRDWWEISQVKMLRDATAFSDEKHWIPYTAGGRFRRWYGNNLSLLYWNNGGTYLTRNRSTNSHFYLQPCLTWTLIGSGAFSARYVGNGYLWDVSGSIGFPKDAERIHDILCFMNCCLANNFIRILNPTINTNIEDIESLPVKDLNRESALMVASIGRACVSQSKWDWDAYETSWDFAVNSLAAAR